MQRILSLSLLWLLLNVQSGQAGVQQVQWDYAGTARLTGFLVQACVVDDVGQCVMHEAQRLSPRRLQTQVQVPGNRKVKCFEVIAIQQMQRSEASNRLCLSQ